MTALALQPSASGTGTVTLTAPNTNSTRTLTLPDTTGTLLENTNPVVAQINGGQLAGFRNKIINGKMTIAQRGASFASILSGVYTLDRWRPGHSTAAVTTISQQADAPSNNEFQWSLRVTVTPTADTSIAAGDFYGLWQTVEGFNARDLIGKTFTLSFWVRSSKTGIHCINFRNATAEDRSYVAEYTINAVNTWEYKTVTVNGGLITTGNWNWINGAGLQVGWTLAAGTTFHTTAGSWQTGNFIATSSQVNCLDTVGNIFAITGVQLEVGSVATPFEHRLYGAELDLCKRYYQRGLAVMGNNNSTFFWSYYGGTGAVKTFPFQTIMCRTPDMSLLNNTNIEYYSFSGVWTATSLAVTTIGIAFPDVEVYLYASSDGDGRGKLFRKTTAGDCIWQASAEL